MVKRSSSQGNCSTARTQYLYEWGFDAPTIELAAARSEQFDRVEKRFRTYLISREMHLKGRQYAPLATVGNPPRLFNGSVPGIGSQSRFGGEADDFPSRPNKRKPPARRFVLSCLSSSDCHQYEGATAGHIGRTSSLYTARVASSINECQLEGEKS